MTEASDARSMLDALSQRNHNEQAADSHPETAVNYRDCTDPMKWHVVLHHVLRSNSFLCVFHAFVSMSSAHICCSDTFAQQPQFHCLALPAVASCKWAVLELAGAAASGQGGSWTEEQSLH